MTAYQQIKGTKPIRVALVDPGLHQSAVVVVSKLPAGVTPPWGMMPKKAWMEQNARLLGRFREWEMPGILVVEVTPTIHGRTRRPGGVFSAGADQLSTERWAGRFLGAAEVMGMETIEVTRAAARAAVARAGGLLMKDVNDSAVRRVLIDLYGGDAAAFGRRCRCAKWKTPGYRRGVEPCDRCRTTCGGMYDEAAEPTTWEVPKGPFHGWTGSHLFAALALGLAAFEPDNRKENP